jgi:hypothetical protein
MVSAWPSTPFTFRALRKTFGTMWLRCDACRRYAPLRMAGLHDVDHRTRTFSCSVCGAAATLCVIEPISERGMEDYRLDARENPVHHPAAVQRLSGHGTGRTDRAGGELPGRSLKGRR